MGKKGGSSWLTAVKRAFRSPSKDSEKKNSRRKVDHQEEDKKTERRRWLFRKQSSNNVQQSEAKETYEPRTPELPAEQRRAIAVAVATAAAAEAAVATAKAAVEIIRLTQPAAKGTSFRQHSAAQVIQTAFRGYLARRALIALKGIVKLQALIRGQNVRKQANMTMKCMQALLRVQARVRDQRARLSHDGGRRSMFAETTNLWESKDTRDRKTRSRDGSYISDDWRECPRTLEELEAILKARNEAALIHDKSLAFAFSQQTKIQDSDRILNDEKDLESRGNWLDKWMASKQWDSSTCSRASTDHRRDSIKTVEMDSLKPSNGRKSRCQSPIHKLSIPHRNALQSPSTPCLVSKTRVPQPRPSSPVSKTRAPQPRPSSPRVLNEERSYSTANTPSLRSNASVSRYSTSFQNEANNIDNSSSCVPNYMAATESAKARIRSQSAPRQRPGPPEKERGGPARKRLSYPIPDPFSVGFGFGQNLRSPSFKSVQAGYVGMEDRSNYSYYADSIGEEISTSSTTDLRRWLR